MAVEQPGANESLACGEVGPHLLCGVEGEGLWRLGANSATN